MDRGVAKRLNRRGPRPAARRPTVQRGAVLFLGLALLLAITAGALSAAQTTSLELRMARNGHDAVLAFNAADAALAEAEAWIEAGGAATDARVHPPGPGYGAMPAWRDPDAWITHGQGAGTHLSGVVVAPRYLVEWMATHPTDTPSPGAVEVFRVTAEGVGSSSAILVRLQATYARARGVTTRLAWVELPS